MKHAVFNAYCPFEIGDKVIIGETGEKVTITDIIAIHSVKTGVVKFAYEFNNDGRMVAAFNDDAK